MLLTALRSGAATRLRWDWIREVNGIKCIAIPGTTAGLKRRKGTSDHIPHYVPITKEIGSLLKKSKEVNDIISWAEDTLFEADGYAADDVVTEIEGKEVTKAQVRKSLLQARKARDTYLPDQLSTIQNKENAVHLESAFKEQAEKELD